MGIKYTQASQTDIESIYGYIATEGGIATADRLIEAIVSTCEDLGQFPNMGRRRPELDMFDLQIRSIGERGYVILYTVIRFEFWIVRIIHGARDIGPELIMPDVETPET